VDAPPAAEQLARRFHSTQTGAASAQAAAPPPPPAPAELELELGPAPLVAEVSPPTPVPLTLCVPLPLPAPPAPEGLPEGSPSDGLPEQPKERQDVQTAAEIRAIRGILRMNGEYPGRPEKRSETI